MVPCATMAAKRLSLKAFGAITLIAASAAWLSGGALTITSSLPGAARIGLAPSPAWLAVWVAAAGIAFLLTRSTSRRFALLLLSGIVLAPWLPGPVPAALYIWTGPLRVWLWTVVLAAVLAPAVIRRAPSWLTRAARDPRRGNACTTRQRSCPTRRSAGTSTRSRSGRRRIAAPGGPHRGHCRWRRW